MRISLNSILNKEHISSGTRKSSVFAGSNGKCLREFVGIDAHINPKKEQKTVGQYYAAHNNTYVYLQEFLQY